jgi:hypothetical protein
VGSRALLCHRSRKNRNVAIGLVEVFDPPFARLIAIFGQTDLGFAIRRVRVGERLDASSAGLSAAMISSNVWVPWPLDAAPHENPADLWRAIGGAP